MGAAWTEGKFGGGLRFDGVDNHVELPNSPALNKLHEGSVTIVAWFKPDEVSPHSVAVLGTSGHSEGLFHNQGTFHMNHWLTGDAGPRLACAGTRNFPIGEFHHLAGITDRGAGVVQLYVNGVLEASSPWDRTIPTSVSGAPVWRMGATEPGRGYKGLKGVLDEVRLYNRALSAEEVAALFRGK